MEREEIKREYQTTLNKMLKVLPNFGNHEVDYIEIDTDMISKAIYFATERRYEDLKGYANEQYQGSMNSRSEGELMGLIGELGICKEAGSQFDESTIPRRGGADTTIKGKTVDVKCCTLKSNDKDNVVVSFTKRLGDADIYIFTRLVGKSKSKKVIYLDCYGWAKEEDVISEKNKVKFAKGYWIKKTNLRPPLKFN